MAIKIATQNTIVMIFAYGEKDIPPAMLLVNKSAKADIISPFKN